MKTRPKKTEEIRERARLLSNNMFEVPQQLMRSMHGSLNLSRHPAPSLAGMNTSSSSDVLGPVCDDLQLSSLQEAMSAKDHDPVADIGGHLSSLSFCLHAKCLLVHRAAAESHSSIRGGTCTHACVLGTHETAVYWRLTESF